MKPPTPANFHLLQFHIEISTEQHQSMKWSEREELVLGRSLEPLVVLIKM
jgi:hypothetical protein